MEAEPMDEQLRTVYQAIISAPRDQLVIFSVSARQDYDGTLTPIVTRPEDATLSEDSQRIIESLSNQYPFVVVSGRSKSQLNQLMHTALQFKATSQGFEISGPDYEFKAINDCELSSLQKAHEKLQLLLAGSDEFQGVQLENKVYNIAIHYRQASDQAEGSLLQYLQSLVLNEPQLALHYGKKVYELRPNVPWHKGKAVKHLMDHLGLTVPVYLGDDVTDEDVFKELEDVEGSVTVLVAETARETRAKYRLKTVSEVITLLSMLVGKSG